MDDHKRDDKAADERINVYVDKADDGELSDDEMSDDTAGYSRNYAKKPDEDTGPDARGRLVE